MESERRTRAPRRTSLWRTAAWFLSGATLLGAGWWFLTAPRQNFPPLKPPIDVVIVLAGASDTLRTITGPDSIARLLAFVNDRNHGWGELDMFGVPIPKITAGFYTSRDAVSREYRGRFGAGATFFETQRAGSLGTRPATIEELEEFAGLIGVPPNWFVNGPGPEVPVDP